VQNLTIFASAVQEIPLGPKNLKWVTLPGPRLFRGLLVVNARTRYRLPVCKILSL